MKRFVAFALVLILAFTMTAGAFAETKYFRFAKLNKTGKAYQAETATKAGGSKYSTKFYVTCLKSVVINDTKYTSNLTSGDKVEFRVFDSGKNMVTSENGYAVCTVYDKTAKGSYSGSPAAGESYYIAARMHKDSATTNSGSKGWCDL